MNVRRTSDTDISRDEVRRQRRELDQANDRAVRATERVLSAAFEDERTPVTVRDAVVGGLARRRFLTLGGFSVATAAVLAACGTTESAGGVPKEGEAPTTSALPERHYSDVVLLRTAGSLERSAMSAYDRAASLLTGAAADLAKQFRAHHQAHATAMDAQVTKLGGQPFAQANPVFEEKVLGPALTNVKSAADALALAHALENVAAHSYQSFVPLLSVPALRSAVMTIGSVEARHAALLAAALGAALTPAVAAIPAAGVTTTQPAATTVAGAVAGPAMYVVPGAFEPLTASQVLLGGELRSLPPLGPNSYAY